MIIAKGDDPSVPPGALWCQACGVQVEKRKDAVLAHVRDREHAPSQQNFAHLVSAFMERAEDRMNSARRMGNESSLPKLHDLVLGREHNLQNNLFGKKVQKLQERGKDLRNAEKVLARDRCEEECMAREGA